MTLWGIFSPAPCPHASRDRVIYRVRNSITVYKYHKTGTDAQAPGDVPLNSRNGTGPGRQSGMKPGNKQPRKKDDPSSDDICGDQSGRKRRLPERIAGAKSIEDKELEYRALFETMAPGVFFQRDDGSFVDANPAALKMFGLTFDKFIGKDFYDPQWKVISETNETLIPEQYPSMIALLTGKPVKDMVVGIFNPERDRVTWVRTNATPQFRQGEAVPYQVFVTMDDITDLKRAHTSLAESEERSRNVFEWSNDAILLHTLTEQGSPGHFIDANQVACRMLGYSRDELITMGPSDIVPVEFHPHLGEIIRQSATNESVLFETRLLRKDGTILPVESSGHLVTYEGKKIWLSHIRDITERRNVQDALKESEERLRQITENSPTVFYVHDRASNQFIYVSPAYEKVWGRPCPELIDDPYSFLRAIYPEDLPSVQEAIRMELRKENSLIVNTGLFSRMVKSAGFTPVITLSLDKQGTVYRVIGTAEDITRRKEAEDALRASEERFRKIFENSPVGMALVTPDFRFFSVNPAWVSMTGYPEPELLNLSFADITHPDHLAGDMEHIQELLAGTIPVYSHGKTLYQERRQHTLGIDQGDNYPGSTRFPALFRRPDRGHHRAQAGRRCTQRKRRETGHGNGRGPDPHSLC